MYVHVYCCIYIGGIWVVYLINEGVGPKLNFTGIHVVNISTTNLTFYIPVYNYYNEKQLLAWEHCNIRRSGCIDSLVFLEVGRNCQAEAGMLWVYYPTHLAAQFRKSLHRLGTCTSQTITRTLILFR